MLYHYASALAFAALIVLAFRHWPLPFSMRLVASCMGLVSFPLPWGWADGLSYEATAMNYAAMIVAGALAFGPWLPARKAAA